MIDRDPAKVRFQIIGLLRLYGLALIALGFVLWKSHWLGVTQPRVGRITVAVGVLVLTVLPALLRRHWRRAA
jgi:hypothetical protein